MLVKRFNAAGAGAMWRRRSIVQQILNAHFTNGELRRHEMDVQALLGNPSVRKFVYWSAQRRPLCPTRER